MNRQSSLGHPGVNGTGVGGPPLPGPTLRFQPQAFHRPPPVPGPTLRFQPQAFYRPPPAAGPTLGFQPQWFRHPPSLLLRSRLPRGTANSCGSLKIAPARSAAPPFDAPPEFPSFPLINSL